jgi:predicted XRE-type DNA-binding protein
MEKRKQKIKTEEMEYTISSGNVYADFGHPNPEEAQTKAELAMAITAIIKEKNLNQQQAAELMGIDQPKVSKITRGLLSEFTIERLMRFLLNLSYDIELKLKKHTKKTTPVIQVVMEHKVKIPRAIKN